MESGFYYLAGPHKGTPEQEMYRVETSLKITTESLAQGIHIFSPIVYGKQIAEGLNFPSFEEGRGKMMAYLLDFLKVSKGMILLTMEGWQKSWGVNQELIFCQQNNIPVYIMSPDQVTKNISHILSTPLDQKQVDQLLRAA
jgi:hypothetical protein